MGLLQAEGDSTGAAQYSLLSFEHAWRHWLFFFCLLLSQFIVESTCLALGHVWHPQYHYLPVPLSLVVPSKCHPPAIFRMLITSQRP